MFAFKSNEEIGLHLKTLILKKYPSIRQFCIAYLVKDNGDLDDQTIVRNLCNRFSQIIKGNKALQTYDLPIIIELLEVSCEEILTCGETKVALNYRKTNYNVACSDNESDWIDLLNREDCIAAYCDEYGKTVLDYAIEFKNYKFIKFLIDNDYITLLSDRPGWNDFGAESKIKERPFEDNRLRDEFYTNKLLRTEILSLAIENGDIDALQKFKAREFAPQQGLNPFWADFDFSQYYDETFIETIAVSKNKVFDYFLEEYTSILNVKDGVIVWIFPFLSELIRACIKNKNYDRALKAISVVKNHNKTAFEQIKKAFLRAAKQTKDKYYINRSFQEAIDEVSRDFHVSKNRNFVSFCPYHLEGIEQLAFGIIFVDCSCKEETVQSKIEESNQIFQNILDIPNHLIKNS